MVSALTLTTTQVSFLGVAGTSFTGDIAIDDISFSDQCCPGELKSQGIGQQGAVTVVLFGVASVVCNTCRVGACCLLQSMYWYSIPMLQEVTHVILARHGSMLRRCRGLQEDNLQFCF